MIHPERSWIGRLRHQPGRTAAEIRAERDLLVALLDRLPDGVIAVDESLTVRFVNASAVTMLGESLPVQEQPLPERAAGVPLRQFARSLFTGDVSVAGGEHTTEAGTVVSLAGLPAGASKLAVLVLTDVTAEERRRRAERDFVANASHELRAPLTAIANAVEALESGARNEPETCASFIRLIGRQSARLTGLTSSLLTLARAQALEDGVQLEPVALLPLLQEVADTSEAGGVQVECSASLGAVAEAAILEQIVSNLLGNALRYDASREITLRASLVGSEAVVEVIDRGPGIPLQHQPRIFDRFYAGGGESSGGFGLGLAIVRDSVHAIGGRVEIDSRESQGTTVRVILPAVHVMHRSLAALS
jgi:two-component system, OmpR family, phosphate regulon sensor histidine kinase PhoR